MTTIFANRLLTDKGWCDRARVTVTNGHISAIVRDTGPGASDHRVDAVLPAGANLHSHTFQRAMAGRTETRAAGQDSFWTWRGIMYRFLQHLTPEDIEAIAAMAFVEMQEAGFASVGEFHYVHHQPGGAAYDDPAELSTRIFAAARQTGIGLTHLPVLYTHGGAGGKSPEPHQERFINSIDTFETILEKTEAAASALDPDTRVGIAPHSLRATTPQDLARAAALRPDRPFHIHIAEQPREVRDIRAWLGARPVEWLLDNAPVDRRWCLVHATHMTDAETTALARSGAVAGLCPITEANLGDGPFNGPAFLAGGGVFGVGSDSNVRISLAEELRGLEYSQRLRDVARNVMIPGEGSVGAYLYTAACRGGAQALGRGSGAIHVGALADLVALDCDHPDLFGLAGDALLDGFVFASGRGAVTDLWSAGRHMVTNGRHKAHEAVMMRYRACITALLDRI